VSSRNVKEARVKPLDSPSGINRRVLLSTLAMLPAMSAALGPLSASAQFAPSVGLLPSWNDGPAKQAIFDFVRATIARSSSSYVFPEDRIAVFDQDGTLWVEQPMYTQVIYCLGRVPAVAAKKPELKNVEPFKTVLSGNREAMAKLSMRDLYKILAATLSGMSVEEFNAEVKTWLETARHPRWNRPYTELVYQPMLEVLRYLRDNAYKTYIVTGGGQDFVRVYAEKVYGIPPEGGRHRGRNEIRLRQGRQAVPDQGAEAPAQRQQRRQAGRNSPDDRAKALRGVRQLDRRPPDAGMDRRGRRRAPEDAGAARRRDARIRLWPCYGLAGQQGRHLHAGALRRGEEGRLDGDQHEERTA
jgi:phosphoglycolate phosphatase-like HAD superfamily hydrolase